MEAGHRDAGEHRIEQRVERNDQHHKADDDGLCPRLFVVKILKDLDESIEGKNVLVIEDIIDSGRTLSYLLDILGKRNPQSLRLCTLLDKPDRRIVDLKADYSLFTIPDYFVIGYGLDYGEYYRNLPYIAEFEN